MSARRELAEPDVDADEDDVGEDVRLWPDIAGSGNPSPDSSRRSSSFKPKEPTEMSVASGRATQADDRPVPTTPKDGARRIG